MDKLPISLQKTIYTTACLDDGSTGAALSAVSRYVRGASAEYRYQSVALKNTRQLFLFQKLLAESQEDDQRKAYAVVRHLYVYIDAVADYRGQPQCTTGDDDCPAMIPALTCLFPLVEQSLETLSLVAPWLYLGEDCLYFRTDRPTFPRLRELTLYGNISFFEAGTPLLERLNLFGNLYANFLYDILQRPRLLKLTHLRVSHCENERSLIPDWIACAYLLGAISKPRFRALVNRQTCPMFKIPVPSEPVPERHCRQVVLETASDWLRLTDLLKEDEAWFFDKYPGISAFLSPARVLDVHPDAAAARAKMEWLERLEGKRGCWLS